VTVVLQAGIMFLAFSTSTTHRKQLVYAFNLSSKQKVGISIPWLFAASLIVALAGTSISLPFNVTVTFSLIINTWRLY
jgi:hypothetical protein